MWVGSGRAVLFASLCQRIVSAIRVSGEPHSPQCLLFVFVWLSGKEVVQAIRFAWDFVALESHAGKCHGIQTHGGRNTAAYFTPRSQCLHVALMFLDRLQGALGTIYLCCVCWKRLPCRSYVAIRVSRKQPVKERSDLPVLSGVVRHQDDLGTVVLCDSSLTL